MVGVRKPARFGLRSISEREPPASAVTEQRLEGGLVVRGRDNEDLPDSGEHEHRQRVIDHRFVIDRHELLAHHRRHGMQPRAGAASQNDPLAHSSMALFYKLQSNRTRIFRSDLHRIDPGARCLRIGCGKQGDLQPLRLAVRRRPAKLASEGRAPGLGRRLTDLRKSLPVLGRAGKPAIKPGGSLGWKVATNRGELIRTWWQYYQLLGSNAAIAWGSADRQDRARSHPVH